MSLVARLTILLLVVAGFFAAMVSVNPALSLRMVASMIDAAHAQVATVDPRTLDAALHDRLARKPVLLDVRTAQEYDVSHLAGARLATGAEASDRQLTDLPRTTELVVYCSVGYRSATVAARLQAQGFTRVRHLSGGIFAWVNSGHPVVDSTGRRVRSVHPYSPSWQLLLEPAYRAPMIVP